MEKVFSWLFSCVSFWMERVRMQKVFVVFLLLLRGWFSTHILRVVIRIYFVLSFFWLLLTFWSASGKSDSFLRSFFDGALFVVDVGFDFFVNGCFVCSFDSRFDFKKEVMKRKMRKPWIENATTSPIIPRVGLLLPMPVKKVRKESTKVENAVRRKMMLLQTRTKSWNKV